MQYLRSCHLIFIYYPILIISILAGGWFVIVIPVWAIFIHIVEDNFTRPVEWSSKLRHTWLFDLILYLHLPASLLTLFVLLWQVTPGDFFGFGMMVERIVGWDVLSNHNQISVMEQLGSAISVGFYLSTNTAVGHELIHQTSNKFGIVIGRWILAIVGDAQFSISHVFGHHVNVATLSDPATARRGESLYHFIIRSALGQYQESWQIETKRLERLGCQQFSLRNRVITGLSMTFFIAAIFGLVAGWFGLLIFGIHCVIAKFLFETINYVEHYGLLRATGTRVEPRHSWDCNTPGGNKYLYNLTRHSDHHCRPAKRYWELNPEVRAIKLQYGYMAHMIIAMVPPLWYKISMPALKYWDQYLATDDERSLVEIAIARNAKT